MKSEDFEIKESLQEGVGKGLFAKGPIKKGAFLIEYTGIPMSTADAEDHPGRYLFEVNEKITLDGDTDTNTAKYINHSCDPNVEAEIDPDEKWDEHINIYSIKAIPAGAELYIDYGDEYFDEFIRPIGCRCGTAQCRGPQKKK